MSDGYLIELRLIELERRRKELLDKIEPIREELFKLDQEISLLSISDPDVIEATKVMYDVLKAKPGKHYRYNQLTVMLPAEVAWTWWRAQGRLTQEPGVVKLEVVEENGDDEGREFVDVFYYWPEDDQ